MLDELELNGKFHSENLQSATEKLWELLRGLIRQINFVSNQNKELQKKMLDASDSNFEDWIEIAKFNTVFQERNELLEKNLLLQTELEEIRNQGLSNQYNIQNEILLEEISKLKQQIIEFEDTKKILTEKNLEVLSQTEIINQLNEQINNKENKLDEFNETSQEIDLIKKNNIELSNENEKLIKELSEKSWIISEFETSLNEKTLKIKSLTEQIINLENDHKYLSEALNAKENDFVLLRLEKEQLESELTKNKIHSRDLLKQIDHLSKFKDKEVTLFDTHNEELEHFKREKSFLLEKIDELQTLNNKFKNDIQRTRSGMLPLNFGNNDDLQEQIDRLQSDFNLQIENKKNLENKLINLENLLILKSEEIQKLEKLVEHNREEFVIHNNKVKSKILDLKKIMIDKGII